MEEHERGERIGSNFLTKTSRVGIKITPDIFIPDTMLRYITRMTILNNEIKDRWDREYPDFLDKVDKFLQAYTSDEERIDNIFSWIKYSLEKYIVISEYMGERRKHVVIDEELVHRSVSIFVPPNPKKNISEEDVREYAMMIPVPDHLIYLKASPETCISRMKNRKEGFPGKYRNLGEDEIENRIKEQMDCFEIVTETLASRGSEVVEMDGEENLRYIFKKFNIQ